MVTDQSNSQVNDIMKVYSCVTQASRQAELFESMFLCVTEASRQALLRHARSFRVAVKGCRLWAIGLQSWPSNLLQEPLMRACSYPQVQLSHYTEATGFSDDNR